MIFDTKRANELLELGGGTPLSMSMFLNEDDLKARLFKDVVELRYGDNYNVDNALDTEICNFPHDVIFEWKDVNFCVVDDEGERTLHISLRCDSSWDQHMEIKDEPEYLSCCMEQAYDIDEDVTTEQVIADITALGATYDKSLEQYFV